MTYEIFLCWKYLKSKKKQKFISFISLTSILGVAIGVCALIVVMAVMNGFDRALIDKFIGMDGHLSVQGVHGVSDYQRVVQSMEDTPGVKAVSPLILGQVMVLKAQSAQGVVVRGIDLAKELKTSQLQHYLRTAMDENMFRDQATVIVGAELAKSLGVIVGDNVDLLSPQRATEMGASPLSFRVGGIFKSEVYEYDASVVFVALEQMPLLFPGIHGAVSRINILMDSTQTLEKMRATLQAKLPEDLSVRTWYERNENLFSALKLEKTVMFVILTLVILVSVFNIASTLVMVIMERTKEIGILKALGASRRSILCLFSLEGLVVGVLGTALGTTLGLVLCWILKSSDWIRLPADIYYVSSLPAVVDVNDVLMIMGSAIGLSFVSTLYPALYAALLNPVEALRYE